MHIIVIYVMYTYIMLRNIKPTYLMTVYCLCGAALIGLFLKKKSKFSNKLGHSCHEESRLTKVIPH